MKNKTWMPILIPADMFPMVAKAVHEAVAAQGGFDASEVEVDQDPPVQIGSAAGVTYNGSVAGQHEARRLFQHQPWSVEDLARLAKGETATTERWARALDVCSEAGPAVWLPSSVVAQRCELTINEWRDAPRKISRHLEKHYPDVPVNPEGEHFWPLVTGGEGIADNGGEVWWTITAEQKKRWDEVRAR